MKLSTEQGAGNPAPSGYFRSHKVSIIAVVALVGILIGSNAYQMSLAASAANTDAFGSMKGTVKVYVDGVLVTQNNDIIEYNMYNLVVCKLWNDSTACDAAATGGLSNFYGSSPTNGCHTYSSSGTVDHPNYFTSGGTRCDAQAALLSNDGTIPKQSFAACESYITTNGLSPVKATTTYTAGSNTLVLTATWTASAQMTVQKACIGMWNDKANAAVIDPSASSNPIVLFSDVFPQQTVNNGQSFQVQWTISF